MDQSANLGLPNPIVHVRRRESLRNGLRVTLAGPHAARGLYHGTGELHDEYTILQGLSHQFREPA